MNILSNTSVTVATFYQFTSLSELPELRNRLIQFGIEGNLHGTILLAPEGINATIAGGPRQVEKLHNFLIADLGFSNLNWKQTTANSCPFRRWKVRIKREIVTLGVTGINPAQTTGTLVNPEQWNVFIDDPDVIVIDTRNTYEVALGTFPRARDPGTGRFSEFVAYVDRELVDAKKRKIAMFCTGGIRCEKASSFLLSHGFEQIYQLRGGILNYLEKIPREQSRWQGECVVFDERVAVDHEQCSGRHQWCQSCGAPIRIEQGTSCDVCIDKNTEDSLTNPATVSTSLSSAVGFENRP